VILLLSDNIENLKTFKCAETLRNAEDLDFLIMAAEGHLNGIEECNPYDGDNEDDEESMDVNVECVARLMDLLPAIETSSILHHLPEREHSSESKLLEVTEAKQSNPKHSVFPLTVEQRRLERGKKILRLKLKMGHSLANIDRAAAADSDS
jgi:hypothetical protein